MKISEIRRGEQQQKRLRRSGFWREIIIRGSVRQACAKRTLRKDPCYKFQHEPLFYAHVAGEKDPWYGDKSQSTLWQDKKPAANRIHPTAKPVELVERALLNSSKAGDVVADPFGGSGCTLITCQRRNRKARLRGEGSASPA
jgi:DNA modification methylase